jgi:hypothetical protein
VNRRLARRSVCLIGPRGRGLSSLLNGLTAATVGDQRHYLDMSRLNRTSFERYVADVLEQ